MNAPDPSFQSRVKDVFVAALDVERASRTDFVREASGGDARLVREVTALLQALVSSGSFLDTPVNADARVEAPADSAMVGRRVGRYEILAFHAAGGMGVVYRARQQQPRREVALKLVRPELVTARTLRRLEYEAELLGRLQHPGIAQVFEAGIESTDAGPQPFFAMEFVDGEALHDAARDRPWKEQVELLRSLCDAVHHAHQRGIIHRDLKPSNILVDRSGQPKVLDFGVARATEAGLEQVTLQKDPQQLVGTVAYRSPEQAAGHQDEVDVRSDVYSLGVIAHELLTGELPHDVRGRTLAEALRTIQEEEPATLGDVPA